MLLRIVASLCYRTCASCGQTSLPELCQACRPGPGLTATTPNQLPVHALGSYGGVPGELAKRLKYSDETLLATRLGPALAQVCPHAWRASSLVPIPLHPERLVERGYNQSSLIARQIGEHTGAITRTHLVERVRKTETQARLLDNQQRQENLHGAFLATHISRAHDVVLVDDVVTSGATIDQCALALRRAGHQVVGALTIAIADRLANATEPKNGERIASLVSLGSS